ncbi:hypothetical protein LXL04_015780 [Taraxacum kok-saghyz]
MEACRVKFFCGMEENTWKIHWIKWNVVLNERDNGGLDVGSPSAFNQALLYKWRWRFLNDEGGGVWGGIVKVVKSLDNLDIIPYDSMRRLVRDGRSTLFGPDVWCGERRLADTFPRLFALAANQQVHVADNRISGRWDIQWRIPLRGDVLREQEEHLLLQLELVLLPGGSDIWRWELGHDGMFSVKEARVTIDLKSLTEVDVQRVVHDRLPRRWSLGIRGITLDHIMCLVCDGAPEQIHHLFCRCPVAVALWEAMARWCQIQIPTFLGVDEIWNWVDMQNGSHNRKAVLEVLVGTLLWVIWTYRNATALKKGTRRISKSSTREGGGIEIVREELSICIRGGVGSKEKMAMGIDTALEELSICIHGGVGSKEKMAMGIDTALGIDIIREVLSICIRGGVGSKEKMAMGIDSALGIEIIREGLSICIRGGVGSKEKMAMGIDTALQNLPKSPKVSQRLCVGVGSKEKMTMGIDTALQNLPKSPRDYVNRDTRIEIVREELSICIRGGVGSKEKMAMGIDTALAQRLPFVHFSEIVQMRPPYLNNKTLR